MSLLVVGKGEDLPGFERALVDSDFFKLSVEVVVRVTAEAEGGCFFCGAGVAVGVVKNGEGSLCSVDEDVLVGGAKLTVESEGEVGPFVEGELFGGLDLGDSGDPAGDDGVAEVTIAK